MNTVTDPLSTTEGNYFHIAIEHLFPSPTQPRKRFDEAKLNDLAESIRMQGVLQPILVRKAIPPKGKFDTSKWPFPAAKTAQPTEESQHFEIVAGERRYRAAKLAGLANIPCFVRELTDLQVLHAQVIENLQRDDLHPIEEAEGYEKLMAQKDTEGKPYSADTIAGEVGKSRAYVYARLKLLALCHEAREAFFNGDLDASTALLIARIPVHKLQIEAVKKVTEKAQYNTSSHREGDVLMSYRAARDYIQDTFMLDLDKAPFDTKDAALLAKCGACTDCEKRTGNQPDLFDDVKSRNVCTDTVCHGMKRAAHVLAIQKAAEENGDKVITGKEAKKIIPHQHSTLDWQLEKHGLAQLDDEIPNDDKGRTWAQALKESKLLQPTKTTGKPAVQKTIVECQARGEMIETINIEDAIKKLREAGLDIKPIADAKNNNNTEAQKKQREKEQAEVEQANAYRKRLFNTLRQQIDANLNNPKPVLNDGLYRILAEHQFSDMVEYADQENAELIAKLYLPDLPEEVDLLQAFQEHIPKMTTQQHFLLLIDMLLVDETTAYWGERHNQPERMTEVAAELGIDTAAIEKIAVAEVKVAQKAAADAAKKAAKTPPSPTPAAHANEKGAGKKAKAAAAAETTA